MWNAITRAVSPSIARCELSHVARVPIDLELARIQHGNYLRALERAGCDVLVLPAEVELPDSVFVEDVAIVLDELAVLTRPGAMSRRAEVATVADPLRRYRPLQAIEAPATLDGGDVLRIGRTLYVGQSVRSNPDGLGQLRNRLAPFGYVVEGVPTRDCLHLKSAVTALSDDSVVLQPAWVDREYFAAFHIIEVDPVEAHAANVLRIGDELIMPTSFPRTRQRLLDAGFQVTTVDVSELQKAEGAVTCCSLVFRSVT
jgi:dimethylargininase